MTQFKRTNLCDGAHEFLQIVQFEGEDDYAVQITAEAGGHGDFIGLFDLDGDEISLSNELTWEIAKEVPEEVIATIETEWESGTLVVARV